MTKAIGYRTSSRDMKDGDAFLPEGDHLDTTNSKLHTAEKLLRAGGADRESIKRDSVYIWETEQSGITNWEYEKTKHLYEVEYCKADVRHRGDATYLASIAAVAERAPKAAAALVEEYWSGKIQNRMVELMVRKAKVIRKLRDKDEQRPERKLFDKREETDEEFIRRINHGDE